MKSLRLWRGRIISKTLERKIITIKIKYPCKGFQKLKLVEFLKELKESRMMLISNFDF